MPQSAINAGPSRRGPVLRPSSREELSGTNRVSHIGPSSISPIVPERSTSSPTRARPTFPYSRPTSSGKPISSTEFSHTNTTATPERASSYDVFSPQFSTSVSEFAGRRSSAKIPPLSLIDMPLPVIDPSEQALKSVRLKMSSHDQEAMRKLRSMMELSDGTSSQLVSPTSPVVTPGGGGLYSPASVTTRSRGSPLSKAMSSDAEGMDEFERQHKGARAATPSDTPDTPSPHLSLASAEYVIAVIGAASVGKTTVIRRALRPWGSSENASAYSHGNKQISSSVSFVEPSGKLVTPLRIEVLELPIDLMDVTSSSLLWPLSIPRVSGVIVCYDATRKDTVQGVQDILRTLVSSNSVFLLISTGRTTPNGIPAVMFACKSDPETALEINAAEGNAIGEPFNVGLIEVSTMTPEGKSKIRNGFRWLLFKLEENQRRLQRKSSENIRKKQLHPRRRADSLPWNRLEPSPALPLVKVDKNDKALGSTLTANYQNAQNESVEALEDLASNSSVNDQMTLVTTPAMTTAASSISTEYGVSELSPKMIDANSADAHLSQLETP
jgi:GTPase SAR1 family protein